MAFISFLNHRPPAVTVQSTVTTDATTAAHKPTRHLSGKVVSFVDGSDSTPEVEANTEKEVEGFSQYLLRIHATSQAPNLFIKAEPNSFQEDGCEWDSHYITEQKMTRIDRHVLPDGDLIDKEYVHITFQQSMLDLDDNTDTCDASAIEDGLSSYLPCSYHNHSFFGHEAEFKLHVPNFEGTDFDNSTTYSDRTDTEHDGAERFWGGVFWELRQKLNRDKDGNAPIDVLIVAAWNALTTEDYVGPNVGQRFVNAILAKDRELYDGEHSSAIRSVFTRRGLQPIQPPS